MLRGLKDLTVKKAVLLLIFYSILLLSLRVIWIAPSLLSDQPIASGGVADYTDASLTNQTTRLDGEWIFHPNVFLDPNHISLEDEQNAKFTNVPKAWNNLISTNDSNTAYGYGTYQLMIKLPDTNEQVQYGFKFKDVVSAANIYVNGELIKTYNDPMAIDNQSRSERGAFTAYFFPEDNDINLTIHVSNNDMPFFGGITSSVKFGTLKAIQSEASVLSSFQIIIGFTYLLHALYTFLVYLFSKKERPREFLYYGLILIAGAFSILIDDEVVLNLPLTYHNSYRFLLFLFVTILFLSAQFIYDRLYSSKSGENKLIKYGFLIISSFIFITPFDVLSYILAGILLVYIIMIIYLYKILFSAVKRRHPEAIFFLLFLTSYVSNIAWGAMIKFFVVDISFYPIDFIFTLFFIVLLVIRRHIHMIDLTQKQSERLIEADERKDQLLTLISHQLKNPLNALINIAQSNIKNTDGQIDKENTSLLIEIGEQMNNMLNDLVDMTNLKDDRVQLNKKQVNLLAIIQTVLDMLNIKIKQRIIMLDINFPDEFPLIYADENRLIQVFLNLIDNALTFTDDGKITIAAQHSNNQAIVKIIDTGIGISKKAQRRIFKPYEKDHISDERGGIGLGLAIAKQLIDLHEGFIEVDSQLNLGSTFTVTLPISDNILVPTKQVKAETFNYSVPTHDYQFDNHTEGKKANILLVDNNAINLELMSQMLSKDYYIYTAQNGEQAIDHVYSHDIDLVISEVIMNQMSGYQLTQILRKDFSVTELPILLIIPRDRREDIHTGFDYGANDYLTKPIDSVELLKRVKVLTQFKQAIAEQLKTEVAWLQAQIQPHFLFNTLNTIASLSEIDPGRMLNLLDQFSIYLRKSFSMHNNKPLILLEDELELVNAYLYIQKERFHDSITVRWDIEDIKEIYIPPLTIQPIVENALKHGILKQTEGGTISITVKDEGDYHSILISDDGIGMPDEQIDQILNHSSYPISNSGIGLINTNRRLKQLLKISLSITSEVGKGTKVSFKVPKS